MSEDLSTPSQCCIRNFFSPGDHSEHCANYALHKSHPRPGAAAPESDDIGQGDGCEGGKCDLPKGGAP